MNRRYQLLPLRALAVTISTAFTLADAGAQSLLPAPSSEPIQSNICIDDDGDGWGWTGSESCSTATHAITPQESYKRNPDCLDTNGDGWGWNKGERCQVIITTPVETVTQTTTAEEHTITTASCFDNDGDGWGWDGTKSCRVTQISQQTQRMQQTPFEKHGKLTVCKTDNYSLCNQYGKPVQLTGLSSHGIHWSGWHSYDRNGCLTENSLDLLANTWGTDIFRIAMYINDGGYESRPEETIRHVNTIISELSDRGMYVIVDFHILAGTGVSGNPLDYLDTADSFFRRIVRDNSNRQNVLYEIANEPQGPHLTWDQIRLYADKITKTIRDTENPDNQSVVIVGTNGWSSFGMADKGTFYDIVDNPVTDTANNLMYAFHFYANDPGHNAKGYKEALNQAVHHIPVFVSEWGTQNASGGGINNFSRATEYLQIMKDKNISWTMWNFSDTEETSAVWNDTSFCNRDQGWHNTENLSATGLYIKSVFDSE